MKTTKEYLQKVIIAKEHIKARIIFLKSLQSDEEILKYMEMEDTEDTNVWI